MLDNVVGKPSPSWKRAQVFLVIFFWIWRISRQNSGRPPRWFWLNKANKLIRRFTPWQIIVTTLTSVYAIRNFDKILGLSAPEPLSRLYSPSYYRATWITTGLDAGFATAMSIRPKWLRDLCSILFSVYYVLYANEADEKLRRFRAVPTVEMLRTTWEKTTNPYIRMVTRLPSIAQYRKILIPRPKSSNYQRPITGYIFANTPLTQNTDLILDFPGGGFVAMSPEHHQDRLREWAVRTRKPVLSIDYGKAPEYPYPYAIDETFDTYRALVESAGTLIGMSGQKLNIIISGDSAGATLAVNVVLRILEHNAIQPNSLTLLPLPRALVLNYAALDFNFTSWMSPENLRVLQSEQSSGLLKDHLKNVSPLSMVGDNKPPRGKRLKRRTSWKDTIRGLTSGNEEEDETNSPKHRRRTGSGLKTPRRSTFLMPKSRSTDDQGDLADADTDEEEEDFTQWKEEDRPLQARVRHVYPGTSSDSFPIPLIGSSLEKQQQELSAAVAEANNKATLAMSETSTLRRKQKEPVGTRLTMTSRTGYFQDRIISPSMMRAMAILYIGPHRNPDFATDYHLSPILTPSALLASFPPLLMQCGEKDPFVDDTVIFAGRVRAAKRARKVELDLAISGKSARFGETLRMSAAEAPIDGSRLAAMRRERDKLARETDDDWVQLVLFESWSHGYLQMPALMSEAKAVIEDLGDWIEDAFTRYDDMTTSSDGLNGTKKGRVSPPQGSADTALNSWTSSETETDDSGITFVPKRHHERSSRESFDHDEELSAPADLPANSVNGSAPQPGIETPKLGSGSRQIGQTITETELMRRRRLLDSHIFD
ncbi:Alpha/Beta hydrolase protein [Mycena floridula]|nr:Alpha/Beta hydrolase protein [Mycena floridula]